MTGQPHPSPNPDRNRPNSAKIYPDTANCYTRNRRYNPHTPAGHTPYCRPILSMAVDFERVAHRCKGVRYS